MTTRANRRGSQLLSIVTPAYKEERNLPVMHERLTAALADLDLDWEWIIVDDASPDRTFEIAAALATADPRLRVYRLSRNFGSHTAVMCGLDQVRGDCTVVMACDLQDPPEVVPLLVGEWGAGNQVVWAARKQRLGETRGTLKFSGWYRWIMRKVVRLQNMPATGADFLLVDRCVVEAVRLCREHNVSIFALVAWMGFRQSTIYYDKQARLHGTTGWTLHKKIKLLVDSVTSFSYAPIRSISAVGFVIAVLGVFYSIFIILNAIFGRPVEGWSSLMAVVLFLGGFQMGMMGVLGEYVWRGLDESRRRPRYLIERIAGVASVEPESVGPGDHRIPLSVTGLDSTGLSQGARGLRGQVPQ